MGTPEEIYFFENDATKNDPQLPPPTSPKNIIGGGANVQQTVSSLKEALSTKQQCGGSDSNNSSNTSEYGWIIVLVIILVAVIGLGIFLYYKGGGSGAKEPAAAAAVKEVRFAESAATQSKGTATAAAAPKGLVTVTSPDQWAQIASGHSNRPRLCAFTSPQCGHCQMMMPELQRAGDICSVPIYNFEHTGAPNEAWKEEIFKQNRIDGFPTLRRYNKGEKISGNTGQEFQGPRTAEAICKFAESGKW